MISDSPDTGFNKIPLTELNFRMDRFRSVMEEFNPEWSVVALFNSINHYYFTGTIQNGILLIQKEGEAVYWVRSSYERACDESLFPSIKKMHSFRDVAVNFKPKSEAVFLEIGSTSYQKVQMFIKYLPFSKIESVDKAISICRAVKTPYELSLVIEAGNIHRRILEESLPPYFKEGMSEAELSTILFSVMMEEGHQSVVRFSSSESDMLIGTVAFGENSLYPTLFDGPGGNKGLHPSTPFYGSRERKLKPGDLAFIDIGCGKEGYHTDKTMTYVFRGELSSEAVIAHNKCREIESLAASMLKPGAIPSEIYKNIMDGLDSSFLENFMGYGKRQVKFIGHGVGLYIDEYPAIAKGFDQPLEENMIIALEPKKGITGVGMVGVENTYIVTPQGGKLITGDHPGLMVVGE